MTMVIIPYTRPSWRVKAALFFIITAWWVQSWAWYSITGLFLADMTTNMDFKAKSRRGIKVGFDHCVQKLLKLLMTYRCIALFGFLPSYPTR